MKNKKQNYIVGIDEAGRGAWAGPIVAGAVIIKSPPVEVKDSKQLSPKKREELFIKITDRAIAWSVGVVSHDQIDKIGIQKANILAFKLALKKIKINPDKIFVDAFSFSYGNIPLQAIIRGDERNKRIAAASIIAKVYRDRIMQKQHKKLPHWSFHLHKGYGTKKHQQLIDKNGLSPIHRRSFYPMNTF